MDLAEQARSVSCGKPGKSPYVLPDGAHLLIQRGDITQFRGDAIVNPANEQLLGGYGCDGAIHYAAGPELFAECQKLSKNQQGERCPTGKARITRGYRLPVRFVIHTVGPIYDDCSPEEAEELLARAHRNCLKLAIENGVTSLAFPGISCGIHGFPPQHAAKVAIKTCAEAAGNLRELHFVLYDSQVYDAFIMAASGFYEQGLLK